MRTKLGLVLLILLVLAAILLMTAGDGSAHVSADDGLVTIYAGGLEDYECCQEEWHFVITSVGDFVPDFVHATWDDGSEADVPLDKVTGGVAHYRIDQHLDIGLFSVSAQLPESWVEGNGQFNVSHGPCSPNAVTITAFEADNDNWQLWLLIVIGAITLGVLFWGASIIVSRR